MSQIVQIKVCFVFLTCAIIYCQASCSSDWFGSKCQYLCHCERKDECDVTGQCPTKCAKGWFGQYCQYQDLSVIPGATVTNLPTRWLTDGDDTTCNKDHNLQSVNISWNTSYPFTWLRVVVNNISAKGSRTDFNFKASNGENVACNNMLISILDETTIDYRCDINETIKELTVTGSGLKFLCSLYISAGRNVALKQHAEHSSIFNRRDYIGPHKDISAVASVAVDGITDNDFLNGSCYHSDLNDHSPIWTLILDMAKPLQRFVIYNRGDCCSDRLQRFELKLYDVTGNIVWTYVDANNDVSMVYTVTGIPKVPVRKIIFSPKIQRAIDHNPVLALCEVEIFAECASGKWGLECNQLCPRECSTWCHQDTGTCLACLGYSDPPLCKAVCRQGTYGENCKNRCSPHCSNTCNNIDGTCSTCKPGYQGIKCDQDCVPGSWGVDCKETCPDKCNTWCHQMSGKCPSCFGSSCSKVCRRDTYGENCKYNCSKNCINTCDNIDGRCSTCKPGYQGSKCDQACVPGNWGVDCHDTCPADCYHLCNPVTGECPSCLGYTDPPSCSSVCQPGTYGTNCRNNCSTNCLNTCDNTDGSCSPCKPGYKGIYCDQVCDLGTWGGECNETCADKCNEWCHPVTGECPTCIGYSDPPMCTTVCRPQTYGVNCKQNCSRHCLILCNTIDGSCSICKDGYQGIYCDQACNATKYGLACQLSCSPLCLDSLCNTVTGACNSCPKGKAGWDCEACVPGTWGAECNETCPGDCRFWCPREDGICPICLGYRDPPLCVTVCQQGTYGRNCKENCSLHCLNTCDHIDGNCSPCKPGYHGSRCDHKDESSSEGSSPLKHFGIGFGSCVVVLIVLSMAVLVFLYIRRRKLKRSEQCEPKFLLVQTD